jgi:altronate hydrolase
MQKRNAIQLNPKDNVAMCIEEIKKGDTIFLAGNISFVAETDIPFAHKTALTDIQADDDITKYGYSIGKATTAIKKGEWIHTHNIKGGSRL